MKKLISLMIIGIVTILSVGCSSDNDDSYEVPITFNDLPATAQEFIRTYYPGAAILTIDREGSVANTAYDVELVGGTDIEFDASGQWTSVDAPKGQSVPSGIALPAIVDYVTGYYPGSGINEIERIIPSGYEIGLTNGVELFFTKDGTFLSNYD